MDETLSEGAERRARLYGERLVENSQLRDALTDTQARQLYDWGLGQLRRAAAAAENRPDPDNFMEERTQALNRVLRQVNGLTPTFVFLVEDELAEELMESFISSVAELTGYELGEAWFDAAMARRLELDEANTFLLLMNALHASVAAHE